MRAPSPRAMRLTRVLLAVPLLLPALPALANPPVDTINAGRCLELKVDGQARRCNHDFRLVDDGAGKVSLVTGYDEPRPGVETVVALTTRQSPDMENAYGYALRVHNVTLMTVGKADQQRHWPATGLCFMVKPNPTRAGTGPKAPAIKPDIVVMCTATLTDKAAPLRRLDWHFVH